MALSIQDRLREKKIEEKDIAKKIDSEQIKPTSSEKEELNNLIRSISVQYKEELTTPGRDLDKINEKIAATIKEKIEALPYTFERKRRMEKLAIANIIGLGPIQQFLDNPDITEIVVQKYDKICIERKGKVMKTTVSFSDEDHLRNVINRILQPINRAINLRIPIVDARLRDGSRVCATIPPVSPDGATLTIRKFQNEKMTPEKYIELGSITEEGMDFLRRCVKAKVSIFVSGGTGTGKTTMLNALSSFLPNDELIITIEDTLELQLKQTNVRRLETRQVDADGAMKCDMAALVKAALRMRPDILILGEVRDKAVIQFLSASSTGHEGSMCTAHANSPENLVNVRIPIMMSMDKGAQFTERSQALMISEAIQVIVQLKRLSDGRRIISRITGVDGVSKGSVKLVDIFCYNPQKDMLECTWKIPESVKECFENHKVPLDGRFKVPVDQQSQSRNIGR